MLQNFITEKSKGSIDEVKKIIQARNKLTKEINELSTIILSCEPHVYIIHSREEEEWSRTQ